MKRLLTSRILACLIFLTIWESKTYAQGSISSYTAGTETFEITSNTSIPKQSTEYQYYASANISLFIGADEVWKNEEIFSGKYYLSSGGNMGIKQDKDQNKQTDAGYYKAEKTTGNSACIALPNTGNYFHFLFHTKGKIKLAFNVKYKLNPAKPDEINRKYLYVEKATNEPVTVVYKKNEYTTRRGITPSSINVTATTETTIEPQESGENKYFKIIGVGGHHPLDIEFDAEAGDEYCIWMSSAEEFALGGFTFNVAESQLFTPWKPVVHRQIEWNKSPKNMKDADGTAPSGVKDITFMYGGWTNHPYAVKAATWNADNSTWGFNDNGTANTTYTINNEKKIDKWEDVKAESGTTEKLVTLDGYGKFTAGCGQVPTDQYGKTYTPATSAIPSVANIPCRGTYYKFEPAKDGTLNVYVRQAADSPLYLVDETGKPQKSIDYKAGNAGIVFTVTEGADVSYTINKLAACRYGFDVKAGKTYVLFQNNAMLGFYGFTFGASSTEESEVNISQNDGYTYKAKNNATVNLTKPLKANVWNAICLPFSMTEQQVRSAFGKDARIAEFKKVDKDKDVALFGMHYYQLITAGKPCLIKPSQESNTYDIQGVTIDAENALTIVDSNKKFDFVGTYATTSMPVNSHYLGSNDGKLYYITAKKEISGLKAFLKPAENNSGAKLSIAFDSTDNDQDNNTTGIEAIKDYTDQDAANSSANKGIYNINGQFVGTNPAILPQGIYVKNGKKFIVK